jgi:hypothetical protein
MQGQPLERIAQLSNLEIARVRRMLGLPKQPPKQPTTKAKQPSPKRTTTKAKQPTTKPTTKPTAKAKQPSPKRTTTKAKQPSPERILAVPRAVIPSTQVRRKPPSYPPLQKPIALPTAKEIYDKHKYLIYQFESVEVQYQAARILHRRCLEWVEQGRLGDPADHLASHVSLAPTIVAWGGSDEL